MLEMKTYVEGDGRAILLEETVEQVKVEFRVEYLVLWDTTDKQLVEMNEELLTMKEELKVEV